MHSGDPKPDMIDDNGDVVAEIDMGESPEKIKKSAKKKAAPEQDQPPADATIQKRGMGFVPVLFMSILAAGAGAVGGAYLSQGVDVYVPGPQVDVADFESLETQVAALQSAPMASTPVDISPLETRLAALESRPFITEDGAAIDPALAARIEALEMAEPANITTDLSPLETRISALEEAMLKLEDAPELTARLEALEKASENNEALTVIDARITALEAAPKAVPVDLSPLESRLLAIESLPAVEAVDVSGLETRLTRLETTLANVRAAIPLPPFPRGAVLAALANDGPVKKGWISRTFSKHVKVANQSSVTALENIEKSLAAEDIDGALALANNLPNHGRAAAQDWIDAVSAQRKLP